MTAPLDEIVDTIVREGHSRIPIYEESIDNVIGILYAKDLLPVLGARRAAGRSRTILRTPLFVPESISVDDLLHNLQRRKVHIAIVLDEYGGTAGLVTIEDLIEEIVGEIQDEYDVEEPMIERLSDNEARIDGRASIDDLAETLRCRARRRGPRAVRHGRRAGLPRGRRRADGRRQGRGGRPRR